MTSYVIPAQAGIQDFVMHPTRNEPSRRGRGFDMSEQRKSRRGARACTPIPDNQIQLARTLDEVVDRVARLSVEGGGFVEIPLIDPVLRLGIARGRIPFAGVRGLH